MKEKVIHEFYTHYSSWHTVHIFTNPRLHHPERERLEAEKAAEAEKRKTEEEERRKYVIRCISYGLVLYI